MVADPEVRVALDAIFGQISERRPRVEEAGEVGRDFRHPFPPPVWGAQTALETGGRLGRRRGKDRLGKSGRQVDRRFGHVPDAGIPFPGMAACVFCAIRDGNAPAHVVLDTGDLFAFLDVRPVFPGHVLVAPRAHHETMPDLPDELVGPLFSAATRVASAMVDGLGADGSFVAVNNRVSQSVPHVHVHVVPRRFRDGLRGFFWPRQRYADDAEAAEHASRIRAALGGETAELDDRQRGR